MDKDQPFEAASPPQACTPSRCTEDEDLDRLTCKKCKRSVHYECTQLPLYQLQIFVTSYNDHYLCSNCVRITKNLRNKVGKNTQHMMQNELKKKDDVIQKLNNEVNTNTKTRDSIKNDLKTFLAGKLQEMEEKTRTMIKEEIKHTTEIMTETSKKTYAEITKKHREDLRFSKEQKRKEEIEKRDIDSRKLNIIVHGFLEYSGPDKEKEENGEKYDIFRFRELLEDINVPEINVTHHRLGNRKTKNGRPLKVTLQSQHDKDLIMKNLHMLKETCFFQVSITEDFTINERKKIKEMHEQAKKLNKDNKNKDFNWRVRGSPRTKLRIVKKLQNQTNISSNYNEQKYTTEEIVSDWASTDDVDYSSTDDDE